MRKDEFYKRFPYFYVRVIARTALEWLRGGARGNEDVLGDGIALLKEMVAAFTFRTGASASSVEASTFFALAKKKMPPQGDDFTFLNGVLEGMYAQDPVRMEEDLREKMELFFEKLSEAADERDGEDMATDLRRLAIL